MLPTLAHPASMPFSQSDTAPVGTVQAKLTQILNFKDFGAKFDGATDDTASVAAAIAAAVGSNRMLIAPGGPCKITSTIQIDVRGVHIIGAGRGRPATTGGTRFEFYGTGPLFQLGTDIKRTGTDGAIASGQAIFTSSTAAFVAGDVGKRFVVSGAGVAAADLTTTIASRQSSTQVTLAATASTSVLSGATWTINPWDSSYYDGVGSLVLEKLAMAYLGGATTPLSNSANGSYGTGTYGVRDWRGGDLRFRDITIENFETGIWGINSDINSIEIADIIRCGTGIYLGPRSDQPTLSRLYSFYCDRALDLDGVQGARIEDCQFVDNGSNTINPIRVGSKWAYPAVQVSFNRCWFENFLTGLTPEAFVDVAVGDTTALSGDFNFNECNILGTTGDVSYFAKVGNAYSLSIKGPGGYTTPISKLVKIVGSAATNILFEVGRGYAAFADYDTSGATPHVTKNLIGGNFTAGGSLAVQSPTIIPGSRGGNDALTAIINMLSAAGQIIDATTAGISVATDDFTAADGTTMVGRTTTTGSKTWAGNAWTIQSNKAAPPSGFSSIRVDTGFANGVLSADVTRQGDDKLLFRYISGTNFIYAQLTSTGIEIRKVLAGVDSSLGFSAGTFSTGVTYTFTVTMVGSSIVAAVAGVASLSLSLSTSDQSTYGAATIHGLYAASSSARYDNFSFFK